jgi:menaquinone-dependent protoporphyrinogen oxidase
MNGKILIAYASKYGSTAEIAEKIGGVLETGHIAVDVMPAGKVKDLSPYKAVILGSAVYVGKWRKEAVNFLKSYEKVLAGCDVWLFSSGPSGEGEPVELLDGWRYPESQQGIIERISPRGIKVFHGYVDTEKLNFIEKSMVKTVKAPLGDYRDWDEITSWGEIIADTLKEESPTTG